MIKRQAVNALFLSICLITLPITNLLSQELNQIDQYKEALKVALDENKKSTAAGICGKIAYAYWDERNYDEAISFFEQSIEHNTGTNKNGVRVSYYNLGLVNIDKQDYQSALSAFSKGIVVARELKQDGEVLSGLINAASINQSLGQYQEAINLAEEALAIAQEQKSISLTKRCYGILYENYQEIGNSEKSIEYFDLYSTVDKFLKDEQVKEIQTQSEQKVAEITTEKAKSDLKLQSSNKQLQVAKDSLEQVRELTERQKLELKLNEVTLREQEAQLENERLIRYGLTIIVGLTTLFLIIVYVQYRQKKQKNILLEQQYDQINSQKEEIEKQGEYLSIKNNELIAVNKEKNLMMSMVAHDLKRPINDLTSLSYILDEHKDKLPEDFNHLVQVLKKSSIGYREMVHKILDAGAIENRKLNVVQEELNLQELIADNLETIALSAKEKNISFDIAELPVGVSIKADKIYLSQAFENIVYNALKYSPADTTVYVGAKKEGNFYKISIRDEGPGIKAEEQKLLFETFKPLSNKDEQSTGLGLSIAKKYMDAMEGDIGVQSEEGNGTTFFLSVPTWP